jgi:ribosomal protein S15P/S13E
VEYSEGFSTAANILLNQVISSRGSGSVDILIYPICFNMRHSVELRLKGAIEEILKLGTIKKLHLSFDLSGSHDIGNIWSFFKNESVKLDKRYEKIIVPLNETINDISEIDATGQTFRYPIDSDSQKHLTDIGGLINCRILLNKFQELEKNLEILHYLNGFLLDEYRFGTFTSKLSRVELMSLANRLPRRSLWGKNDFNEIKSNIRSEFNLTSNDLTKALNIIQANYELAHKISMKIELLGMTEKQLLVLIERWVNVNSSFKDHSPKSYSFTDRNSKIFAEMAKHDEITKKVLQELIGEMTPEYLAGLNALLYFARNLDFSENYK